MSRRRQNRVNKKESTDYPRAMRCFPEGKEAKHYVTRRPSRPPSDMNTLSYTLLSAPGSTLGTVSRHVLSSKVSINLASVNKIIGPRKVERREKKEFFTGLSALRESTGLTRHTTFAKPKRHLAVWANYLVLCVLPL